MRIQTSTEAAQATMPATAQRGETNRTSLPRHVISAITSYDYRFVALYVVIGAIYTFLTYQQAHNPGGNYHSDLHQHIIFANQFYAGQLASPESGLYLMWFVVSRVFGLTTTQAAIIVDPLIAVAIAFIIQMVLAASGFTFVQQFIFTGVLMIVTPIFAQRFNPLVVLGQISPTIYHNPTLLAVKPFAYLTIIFSALWLRSGRWNAFFWATIIVLFLGTITKPNFILAFGVAFPAYLLLTRQPFDRWWKGALLFALSIVALAVEYVIAYQSPGAPSHIGVDILTVWLHYSPNPLFSILFSLAFPLALLVFRWKQVIRSDMLALSWLTLGVAILEYSVFVEEGARFIDGNFSWGMMAAVPMVFLFSVVEWVRWKQDTSSPRFGWAWWVTGGLLALQFFSGAFYLVRVLKGHQYY